MYIHLTILFKFIKLLILILIIYYSVCEIINSNDQDAIDYVAYNLSFINTNFIYLYMYIFILSNI